MQGSAAGGLRRMFMMQIIVGLHLAAWIAAAPQTTCSSVHVPGFSCYVGFCATDGACA
jgi:hypothetical protein